MNGMEDIRRLRRTLEDADTDGRGVWAMLHDLGPSLADVRTALDLAYEIGYADGESSRAADAIIEADQ